MVKTKRVGAEAKRVKPFLDVKVYEPVSKKITILRDSEITLKLYAKYKNEISGLKTISEDSILDALISTLEKDLQFLEWKEKNISKQLEAEISNHENA